MIPGKRQMTSVSEKLEEAFCTLSGGEQAGSLRTENLTGRFREPFRRQTLLSCLPCITRCYTLHIDVTTVDAVCPTRLEEMKNFPSDKRP